MMKTMGNDRKSFCRVFVVSRGVLFPPLVAVVFVLLCVSTAFAADVVIVVKKDGAKVEGKLKKETWKVIQVSIKGGAPSEIRMDEVESIRYKDVPAAFSEAERLRQRGMYSELKEAIESYTKVADNAGNPAWSRHYSYFYMGMVQKDIGKLGDAVKSFSSSIETIKDGRFALEAALERGICLTYQKKLSDAEKEFDALNKSEYGTMQLRASLWLARVKELGKEYDKASQMFDSVAIQASRHPSIRDLAKVGAARALLGKGSVDRAYSKASILRKDIVDVDASAALFNVLGDCKMAKAKDEADEKKKKSLLLDAVIFYLHVDIQSPVPSEHPYALKQAAKAFADMGQDDRAQKLKDKRKQLYPGYK